MFDVPDEYSDYVYPEPDEVPQTLYHVAYRKDRHSIDEEGLSVDADRTHNTGGGYGDDPDDDWLYEPGDEGELMRSEWRPHGVYLWPTLEQALEYGIAGDVDIYEIDAEKLDVIRDPSVAPNWGHEPSWNAYVAEYVPEAAIRRLAQHEVTAHRALHEQTTGYSYRPAIASLQDEPMDQLSLDDASGHSL